MHTFSLILLLLWVYYDSTPKHDLDKILTIQMKGIKIVQSLKP